MGWEVGRKDNQQDGATEAGIRDLICLLICLKAYSRTGTHTHEGETHHHPPESNVKAKVTARTLKLHSKEKLPQSKVCFLSQEQLFFFLTWCLNSAAVPPLLLPGVRLRTGSVISSAFTPSGPQTVTRLLSLDLTATVRHPSTQSQACRGS